jgi:hypothetical protein
LPTVPEPRNSPGMQCSDADNERRAGLLGRGLGRHGHRRRPRRHGGLEPPGDGVRVHSGGGRALDHEGDTGSAAAIGRIPGGSPRPLESSPRNASRLPRPRAASEHRAHNAAHCARTTLYATASLAALRPPLRNENLAQAGWSTAVAATFPRARVYLQVSLPRKQNCRTNGTFKPATSHYLHPAVLHPRLLSCRVGLSLVRAGLHMCVATRYFDR